MSEIDLPKLKCGRCNHEWTPRKKTLPKVCPNCNSPYWNKPRKNRHAGVYEPTTKVCKDCGVEKPLSEFKLVSSRPGGRGTKEYWVPDVRCKECKKAKYREWYKTHPQAQRLRKFRKDHSTCDYSKSSFYLGVVIAERVLSAMFERVDRMPNNTPGFDFICGRGFKIDCKSACKRHNGGSITAGWFFGIKRNTVADYFVCLAFDNRTSLTPVHVWLIPGKLVNHLASLTIMENIKMIEKWREFERPADQVRACCEQLKSIPS